MGKWGDTQFEEAFAKGSIDPAEFDHVAHLRLAWIHVTKYGEVQAIENIRRQLKSFTAQVGAADKYHETITVAAIKAVKHFVDRSRTTTFDAFITQNFRLKDQFRHLLGLHYSRELFESEEARKTYLSPDLIPFD